jgi:hypothetical protein
MKNFQRKDTFLYFESFIKKSKIKICWYQNQKAFIKTIYIILSFIGVSVLATEQEHIGGSVNDQICKRFIGTENM